MTCWVILDGGEQITDKQCSVGKDDSIIEISIPNKNKNQRVETSKQVKIHTDSPLRVMKNTCNLACVCACVFGCDRTH